jgi:uncharacterized hydrophobic protein (TIGR00271 family)
MATTSAGGPPDLFQRAVTALRRWWHGKVADTVEQAEVIALRREECALTERYLFLLAMSAGIAILGLLLSSPAVVIGAMLLSPLMGPIMGLGFAIAIGDFAWMRQASRTLAIGTAMGILLCAAIVLVSPLQTVTSEIASRTRPSLFDLLVALFSALAGAYAMIRGREGTIVGVAIATALMPPLAVIGFGLATWNWTVFSGALLLFFTNLMTIALTAAIMARFYGFRTSLSPQQTNLQTLLIVAAFVALAVPLGYSLRTIAWEANASRQISAALLETFNSRARISQVEIDYHSKPIHIVATVLTPRLRPEAERLARGMIARQIGIPVDVAITQYQVGTSSTAAEQAELAAARAKEDAGLQRAQRLAARLALIAGVAEEDVVVDRDRRRAIVTARTLPGATLATYRELERRIAAGEPDWTIALRPPLRPLPSVAIDGTAPSETGAVSLEIAAWAARRTGWPVLVSGPAEAAAAVAEALKASGVEARVVQGRASGNEVGLSWDIPEPR